MTSSHSGRQFTIKKVDQQLDHVILIRPIDGAPVDGVPQQDILLIHPNASVTVVATSEGWQIVSRFDPMP